ncbi:unnamed protein product [Urochloa humidicola]
MTGRDSARPISTHRRSGGSPARSGYIRRRAVSASRFRSTPFSRSKPRVEAQEHDPNLRQRPTHPGLGAPHGRRRGPSGRGATGPCDIVLSFPNPCTSRSTSTVSSEWPVGEGRLVIRRLSHRSYG